MKVFIFAGEASGDVYGELLINSLFAIDNGIEFFGVCGPGMRGCNICNVANMEEFRVMGFVDVAIKSLSLLKLFRKVRGSIIDIDPDVVILIDYAEFNLRMAKSLKNCGYSGKIVQYVSPTVWAWRKDRMFLMEKFLDLLLVIFPFEVGIFSNVALKVKYVGNPSIYRMKNKRKCVGDESLIHLVSIFPGSRKKEIIRNLPLQLLAARSLVDNFNVEVAISVSDKSFLPCIRSCIDKVGEFSVTYVFREDLEDMMQRTSLALATSGTVTMELAAMKVPTVVTYKLSLLDFLLAKYLFKISMDYYCIVNIVCGEEVFPEFVAHDIDDEKFIAAVHGFFSDDIARDKCRNGCEKFWQSFGSMDPGEGAAKEIYGICGDGI